uniref:hypothetical protein n=1 Tax=Lachnoclostridium phocaeense TaxID=1871021 RepID=UPI0026DC6009|nr:hypothetical protein [Lachnoclostridium phocaeense]
MASINGFYTMDRFDPEMYMIDAAFSGVTRELHGPGSDSRLEFKGSTGEEMPDACVVSSVATDGTKTELGIYDMNYDNTDVIRAVSSYLAQHFPDGFSDIPDFDFSSVDREPTVVETVQTDRNDGILTSKEMDSLSRELIPLHGIVHFPYETELGSGFIPLEMREGFYGADERDIISRETIAKIRDEYDPGFGKILGLDTSTFVTKTEEGLEKNGVVVPLKFEDLEGFINKYSNLDSLTHFTSDKVETIRAYKQFGEGVEVDGSRFGVGNLVTIEVKCQGIEEPFRSSYIVDDAGRVWAEVVCHHMDERLPLSFKQPDFTGKEEHDLSVISKLDRTDTSNPGHLRIFNGKDDTFKSVFMEKVDQGLSAFFDRFADERIEEARERIPYMDARREVYVKESSMLKDTLGTLELYKELTCAEMGPMEEKLLDLSWKISDSAGPTDRTAYKQEFAELYREYRSTNEEKDPYALNRMIDTVRDVLDSVVDQYNAVGADKGVMFGRYTNYSSRGVEYESFADNISPEGPMNPIERFTAICTYDAIRTDLFPFEDRTESVLASVKEFMPEVQERLQDAVDLYNESVPDGEKVSLSDDGTLYTEGGMKIEPDRITDGIVKFPRLEEGSPVESVRVHPDAKTQGEIRADFLERGIRGGVPDTSIYKVGTQPFSDMVERICTRYSGGQTSLYELRAICRTVDQHYREKKLPAWDDFEKEVRMHEADIDRETPKVTIQGHRDPADMDQGQPNQVEQPEGVDSAERDPEQNKETGRGSDFENDIRQQIAGAYGKVDETKDIDISKSKMNALRDEARIEAQKTGKNEDEILIAKISDLKEKLSDVREDILHYKEAISGMDFLPMRALYVYTPFHTAKMEMDHAIKAYVNLGGAVGNETFVTKGVSKVELLLDHLEYARSNPMESAIYTMLSGEKMRISDIYSDSVERYSGEVKILAPLARGLESIGGVLSKIIEVFVLAGDKLVKDQEPYRSDPVETPEGRKDGTLIEGKLPWEIDQHGEEEKNWPDTVENNSLEIEAPDEYVVSGQVEQPDVDFPETDKAEGDESLVEENGDQPAKDEEVLEQDEDQPDRTDLEDRGDKGQQDADDTVEDDKHAIDKQKESADDEIDKPYTDKELDLRDSDPWIERDQEPDQKDLAERPSDNLERDSDNPDSKEGDRVEPLNNVSYQEESRENAPDREPGLEAEGDSETPGDDSEQRQDEWVDEEAEDDSRVKGRLEGSSREQEKDNAKVEAVAASLTNAGPSAYDQEYAIAERISEVFQGNEDLQTVIVEIADLYSDDVITEHDIAKGIVDAAFSQDEFPAEAVGDIVIETMAMLDNPDVVGFGEDVPNAGAFGQLVSDMIQEQAQDMQGDPVEKMENHIADFYEENDPYYDQFEYGEYNGYIFEDGVVADDTCMYIDYQDLYDAFEAVGVDISKDAGQSLVDPATIDDVDKGVDYVMDYGTDRGEDMDMDTGMEVTSPHIVNDTEQIDSGFIGENMDPLKTRYQLDGATLDQTTAYDADMVSPDDWLSHMQDTVETDSGMEWPY